MTTTTGTYRPIPIGELLEKLRNDGFQITPDSYRRVFAVVNTFFPDGLPVDAADQPIESARQELCQLLGPVLVRNETEQERFAKQFHQLVIERATAPPQPPLPPPPPPPPAWKGGFIQVILLLLTGGWLLWLASTKPTPTPTQKADIQIKVVDWQTRRFQLDSTTASQIDTIWWDFGDSTRFGIAEAGSVVHTYRQVGDYRIKASWRNNSVLDSTTVMTKIIDADSCRLDFDVVSKGDSYTFINQSPGLKAGFAYQFSFGDGSKPVVSKRNFITHTYASDTAQYSVMLTALVANCQNRATQYIGKASFSPVSAGLRRMADKRVSVQVMMAWWLPFLLIGSTATVAGLVLVNWFRGQQRAQTLNSKPPFALSFPDQSAGIRVGASMDDWARQLQQRDEGSRRLLDVPKTVLATARRGGYPVVQYQRMKSRPRYVVLIDYRSAQHQQAQLYSFLTTVLIESDVEVEPFYFHTDPRYCWNETYPKGLSIEALYRFHATSSLILITEGTRLIDYDERALAEWVPDLLGGWTNRAILTPVYPENWNVVEAILSQFFVVLPATPDGQLLLRSYFQSQTLPSFADLRQTFGISGLPKGRGIFGKTPSALTVADVRTFLEKSFPTESIDSSQQELLWQWACATAVYSTPNYEITVAIGKAIEAYAHASELVTTSNLLKITTLPHLKQSVIPDDLQDALLRELPRAIEQVARQAVLDMLDKSAPPLGSRAETDRNLQRWIQWLELDDPEKRKEALRELQPYQQTGSLANRRARQQVEQKINQKKQRYSLALAGITILLMSIAALWSPTPAPRAEVAGWMAWAYKPLPLTIDSAVYYNNRAVGRLDTARTSYTLAVATQYQAVMQELIQSLRYRVSAEALQNLHALRYDRAMAYWQTPANVRARLPQRTLSPMGEIPVLMAPIRRLDPAWIPADSTLMAYMLQIVSRAPVADVYAALTTKAKAEFNEQRASQSVLIGAVKDTTGFAQLVHRAQERYAVSTINLLIRPTTANGPNVRRVRLKQVTLRTEEQGQGLQWWVPASSRSANALVETTVLNLEPLDRLVSLEAARILLYYNGPQPPTILRPVLFGSTTKNSSIRKTRRVPAKTTTSRPSTYTPTNTYAKGNTRTSATIVLPQPSMETNAYTPIQGTTQSYQGRITSPTYSLSSVAVRWDTKSYTPSSRRGLPDPYGVLVGQLMDVQFGEDVVFLLVKTDDELYQVAVSLGSQEFSLINGSMSPELLYPANLLATITPALFSAPSPKAQVWALSGKQVDSTLTNKLFAAGLYSKGKPGFYPLEKTPDGGSLDYIRQNLLSDKNSFISISRFKTQIESASLRKQNIKLGRSEFLKALLDPFDLSKSAYQTSPKSLVLQGSTVLIWGTRRQLSAGNAFDLPAMTNFQYEIHSVHLNQGFSGENLRQNAPWQDGGIMLLNNFGTAAPSSQSNAGAVIYLIQLDGQTLRVDDNGDPLSAATGK